jgi:hypothetical protein
MLIKIWWGKLREGDSLEQLGRDVEENTAMDCKETGWEVLGWIDLAQN